MSMFQDPLDEPTQTTLYRAVIGGNNPPSAIDDARAAYAALAEFLASTPVIANEADAKSAKLFLDRSKLTLKDVEAAKDKEAKPLYDAHKAALAKYKPATDSLTKLLGELEDRIKAYLKAEKAKQAAIAAAAAAKAAEAERLAREAEAKEREAIENAKAGEFTDVGAATQTADTAFKDYERASRAATIAERDTNVRLGGGFSRSIGLRTEKTLVLDDAIAVINCVGTTDGIRAALLTAARAYKKLNGKWPNGVHEDIDEGV